MKLLKEKEEQIKNLQEYIDAQKSEKMKIDLSYTSVKSSFLLMCDQLGISSIGL